jgi:hypothetical protein
LVPWHVTGLNTSGTEHVWWSGGIAPCIINLGTS